ncbi:MAG: long-chain fatty acid--CoA ligase [Bdellovibrionaceae bacterium]|nr:long-chain fatty acid--CoA ligase [Pseudobdellovibrionaceae bacterium]NUM57492.1 long-chain fatty acid--CoA ligase [Pseudobdellovibrionaceae bacterium]
MKTEPLPLLIPKFAQREEKIAFKYKDEVDWKSISWSLYQKDIYKFAIFLLEKKIGKNKKVALISNTRYEWCVIDFAIMSVHGISIPIYQNSTPEEMKTILNHSEAELLILENSTSLKAWSRIKHSCPHIKNVVMIEQVPPADKEINSIEKILSTPLTSDECKKIEKLISEVKINDLATIVYTSGTTGAPKGVMLTHEQIVSEVTEAFATCGISSDDLSLTFLPFAHVLGRIESWAHCYFGHTIAFAESIDKIKSNLVEINPTLIFAVPRIFEKVYTFVVSSLENNKYKAKAFHWALHVGKKVCKAYRENQRISAKDLLAYEVAKKLILKKVKLAFGNRLRFCVSGGAAINRTISEFFEVCGVLILEGYGLTETTAAICVNTPYNYKFGSVGLPIGDVQLKIAEDGEILVKSKKVMVGYYNNPEATQEALENGWFKTGDIGEILPGGDLKITDRKKDLIKTANGKYVAPQKLEGILKLNPFIGHALIHGDQKKYIIALISLEKEKVIAWCKENQIETSDWKSVIHHQLLVENIRKTIVNINAELASHESIKKYLIIEDEFTVENGSLTPSLKVKRKVLDAKYKQLIDSLYD